MKNRNIYDALPCIAPDILKAQSILSETRSKTILETRKRSTFLQVINKSIIYKFFKDSKVFGNLVNKRLVDHMEKWGRLTGW